MEDLDELISNLVEVWTTVKKLQIAREDSFDRFDRNMEEQIRVRDRLIRRLEKKIGSLEKKDEETHPVEHQERRERR